MAVTLEDRRKALEESFFHQQEQRLIDQLREKRKRETKCRELADAAGVQNASLLTAIIDQGIEAETLAAFMLVPLVATAWASGSLEASEREAVLEGAAANGIQRNTPVWELLQRWLDARPPDALLDTWIAYAREFRQGLSPEEQVALREGMMARLHAIAQAAGGFLGLGSKVSADEQAVMDRIEAALGG